jgi:predicted nucleic acid-binding protein
VDNDMAWRFVEDVSWMFSLAPLSRKEVILSQNKHMSDFEDALQIISAESVSADVIITRDVGFIGKTQIPVMTPEEFLDSYFY